MKKGYFLIGLAIVFALEIVALVIFAVQTPNFSQDTVAVNEVLQSVTRDYPAMSTHKISTDLDYVVVDENGALLYKTKDGLSESINAAVAHRDTILDVTAGGKVVGKVIVYNDRAQAFETQKHTAVAVLSAATAVQCAICVGFGLYVYLIVIRPFRKMKGFAERIAGGNLDVPLEMDRRNLFGAFTESFDIMRSELKKARLAEAQANAGKKELVAKLSHDVKTPVASIKAVAEVGLAVSNNEKDKANYTHVIGKADQINNLISNLFTATLEELQQLTVTPTAVESKVIGDAIANADYMRRVTTSPKVPDCLVYADKLRLQQVFDNVFANSYKYADTEVTVSARLTDDSLCIAVEDFGGGVSEDELPTLKEKFKRGRNAANVEGAGLGLYISDYFVKEMRGELILENGEHGLKVTVCLPLAGSNLINN